MTMGEYSKPGSSSHSPPDPLFPSVAKGFVCSLMEGQSRLESHAPSNPSSCAFPTHLIQMIIFLSPSSRAELEMVALQF